MISLKRLTFSLLLHMISDKEVKKLLKRGWVIVEIEGKGANLFPDFDCIEKASEIYGDYRLEKGLPVGRRVEENYSSMFLETRLDNQGSPFPFTGLDPFSACVKDLFNLYSRLGSEILVKVCDLLGLDNKCLLDLTDLHGVVEGMSFIPNISPDELSSSLLRICRYDFSASSDSDIVFGSHTDTSLLTLGIVSDSPGLEIYDNSDNQWVTVEKDYRETHTNSLSSHRTVPVVVFVGEYLSILTSHAVKAAVHRVSNRLKLPRRISCPFLIRGRESQVIRLKLSTTGSDDAEPPVRITLPDLNGVSVGTLHTMIDFKRKKCAKGEWRNKYPDSWVLCAFPEHYEGVYLDDSWGRFSASL